MTLVTICVFCALSGFSASADEGYLGVKVVDNAAGQTVFSWFEPGPLDGSGLHSKAFDLHRPDVLVSIDGKAMNAEEFNAYIASRAPGTSVTIEYLKATTRDTADIPANVVTDGDAQTITVTLESKEVYTGTIGRPNSITREIEFTTPPLLVPFDPDNVLGAAVAENDLREEVEKLIRVFHDTIEETDDYHMLPFVRFLFQHPFFLAEVQHSVDAGSERKILPLWSSHPRRCALATDPVNFGGSLISEVLNVEGIGGNGGGRLARFKTKTGDDLSFAVMMTNSVPGGAFRTEEFDREFAIKAINLLRVPRESFYIAGQDAKSQIEVIRKSQSVEWKSLGNSFHDFARAIEPIDDRLLRQDPLIDAPPGSGVDGKVNEAVETRLGWIVVGSLGPNRYDMTKIAAVYDVGGDDEYWASDLRIGTRAIIDLEGNDTYTGTADQGPGGAILGVSFIDDRAGNDTYKGEMLSCGAAIYGVSLLLDRGGDDV